MSIDRRDHYEKEYIQKASRGGLLSHDIGLLIRQYRSHTQGYDCPLTRDQRWAWVAEAAAVLRLVEAHCHRHARQASTNSTVAIADPLTGLQTPEARRQWAAQAYGALLEAQSELHRIDLRTSGFNMTDAAAWNLLMRENRRPVTYKTHEATEFKPSGIVPPHDPREPRGRPAGARQRSDML